MPPLDDPYSSLTMRVLGGVAIGDGSQGREVQTWSVDYVAGQIRLLDSSSTVRFTLTVVSVLTVCIAFDTNMSPCIGYTKSDGSYVYFYNSLSAAYETLFVSGAGSCRVCVDKSARFFEAASDVIFAYTLTGQLYYRQQRDRFAVQYLIGPASGTLVRVGPNLDNRLQFQIKPS